MSRQYSNRTFVPPNNSSRQQTENEFSYFQYPPHRQTIEPNSEINHHPLSPLSRITAAATTSASTPNYHFENPSAAAFTRHPPWFDGDWEDYSRTVSRPSHHNNHSKRQRSTTAGTSNSQPYDHHERKRSRQDENEREQQYRSHHYQPYSNHRSTPTQVTNPTPRHFPRSHTHHQSPPIVSPHRQSTLSSNAYQRPSSPFLLTDLLHRVIDAHAASYSDNPVHHPPPSASIDLIAYTWMSPSLDIFSLPTAFSFQFSDFFDLIIPDETPVVGLTDSEIERLPTMIYSKSGTNNQSDDKCVVCLNEYTNGEKLKRLRCNHYFHSECIEPWLKTTTRCPICRGEQTS